MQLGSKERELVGMDGEKRDETSWGISWLKRTPQLKIFNIEIFQIENISSTLSITNLKSLLYWTMLRVMCDGQAEDVREYVSEGRGQLYVDYVTDLAAVIP